MVKGQSGSYQQGRRIERCRRYGRHNRDRAGELVQSEKQFGFVKLDERLGDAFLHMTVLKDGGFYFVPRGTIVDVPVVRKPKGA